MKSWFLLNIGNTHTQIRHPGSKGSEVVATRDLNLSVVPPGAPCAVACVVPEFRAKLQSMGVLLVTPETAKNLDFSLVDVSTLGADRIANLAALSVTGELPAICLDFGTAVNAEILAPENRFSGGFIAPGRTLMRNALHSFTAQLPVVPLDGPPPVFPGTNTESTIRCGTDLLLTDAVRAFLERTRALFPGRALRVVCCGGDAEFFRSLLPELPPPDPEFTMCGIQAVMEWSKS